jgi:hypothetical protein
MSRDLRRRLFDLSSSAACLAVLALVYAILQIVNPLSALHSNDFKHIYLGMQAIWEGRDPYGAPSLLAVARDHGLADAALNPYVYLPFTGLVLGFLKPLSFAAAAHVWFAVNQLMLMATLLVWAATLHDLTAQRFPRLLWLNLSLLGAAVSHPLTRTLTAGQLNLVLMLCYALAFRFLVRRRDRVAGAVLGFAAMFKIAPAFFLLHWVLVRRWRAMCAMLATIVALAVISVFVAGWRVHVDFLPVLAQMGYGRSTWQEYGATFWKDPWNQSLNALFTHLLVEANRVTLPWAGGSQALANAVTVLCSFGLLAAYAAVALRHVRRSVPTAPPHADVAAQALFHAALLLTLLLPSLMWDHYLVLLLLPATWLVAIALDRRWIMTLLLAVLLYVLTALPIRFDSEAFRSGAGVLLMSAKLFPTLALLAVLLWVAAHSQKACEAVAPHQP